MKKPQEDVFFLRFFHNIIFVQRKSYKGNSFYLCKGKYFHLKNIR